MKIAWLVNNIAQVGGIEQVVCGLSTYFVRVFGFDVTIFSINTFEGVPFFQIDKNVKINHCKLDWRKKARSALEKPLEM